MNARNFGLDALSNPNVFDNLCVLDTETTGFDPRNDEVLSLSIIDKDGNVLFDELFGAARHDRWDCAQAVHGIAPRDVLGRVPLADRAPHVAAVLARPTLIVGYNLAFDLAFLESAGIAPPAATPRFDVMRAFAHAHGLRDGRHGTRRWVSLEACARHYGHAFHAHTSLDDARATLFCLKRLVAETT